MRTWLFAPGHEERKARKAMASDAAFVILDWEDAVPSSEKERARRATLALHDELRRERPADLDRLCVRVNSPQRPELAADLAALGDWRPAVVLVPKVESPDEVRAVAAHGAPLMLVIESALGVERAWELARAHERVRYLAFGPLDLMADLGGTWTPGGEETLYARSRVAIAARAAGIVAAIDGPWPRLQDLEGLEDDTGRGRRLGYGGRLVIHPAQLGPVERAYAPREEDVAFARRVVEAAGEAEAEGRGAISVDGRFVDAPVIKWAEKVLAEASEDQGR